MAEEELSGLSLWLKNEAQGRVGKVTISKRLKDVPAVIYGSMSAQMMLLMKLAEQKDPTMAMN